jgi:hypothetical protein
MRRALRKEFSWTKARRSLWGLNVAVVWGKGVEEQNARSEARDKARKRGL